MYLSKNIALQMGIIGFAVTLAILISPISGISERSYEEPPQYNYDSLPQTSFSCKGKLTGRYYADSETDCQMFHVCVKMSKRDIQDFRFLCPNGTVFDQEHQVCIDYYQVVCHSDVGTNPLGQIFEIMKLTSANKNTDLNFGRVPLVDPEFLGRNNLGEDFQAAEYNNNKLAARGNTLQYSSSKNDFNKQREIFYRSTTAAPVTTTTTTTTTERPLVFRSPISSNGHGSPRTQQLISGHTTNTINRNSNRNSNNPIEDPAARVYETTVRPTVFHSTYRTTDANEDTTNSPAQSFQQQSSRFNDEFFRKIDATPETPVSKAAQFFVNTNNEDYSTPIVRQPTVNPFTQATTKDYSSTYAETTTSSPFFSKQSQQSARNIYESQQPSRSNFESQQFSRNSQENQQSSRNNFDNRNNYQSQQTSRNGNDQSYRDDFQAQQSSRANYHQNQQFLSNQNQNQKKSYTPNEYTRAITTVIARTTFTTPVPTTPIPTPAIVIRAKSVDHNSPSNVNNQKYFSGFSDSPVTSRPEAARSTQPQYFQTGKPQQLFQKTHTTEKQDKSHIFFKTTSKPQYETPSESFFSGKYYEPTKAPYTTSQTGKYYETTRTPLVSSQTGKYYETTRTPLVSSQTGKYYETTRAPFVKTQSSTVYSPTKSSAYSSEPDRETTSISPDSEYSTSGSAYTDASSSTTTTPAPTTTFATTIRPQGRRGARRRVNPNRQRQQQPQSFDPQLKYSRRSENLRVKETKQRERYSENNEEIFSAEASVFPGRPKSNTYFQEERKDVSNKEESSSKKSGTGDSYGRRLRPFRREQIELEAQNKKESRGEAAEVGKKQEQRPPQSSRVVKRLRQKTTTTTTEENRAETTTEVPTTVPPKQFVFSHSTLRPVSRVNVKTKTVTRKIGQPPLFTTPQSEIVRVTTTEEPILVTASDEEIRLKKQQNKEKKFTTIGFNVNEPTKAPSQKPYNFGNKNGNTTSVIVKVTSKSQNHSQQSGSFSPSPFSVKKPIITKISKTEKGSDGSATKSPDYDYAYYNTDDDTELIISETNKDKTYGKKGQKK